MNQPEPQPKPHQPHYFDPDAPDMSEQEFSASLENIDRPAFVLDDAEAPLAAIEKIQGVPDPTFVRCDQPGEMPASSAISSSDEEPERSEEATAVAPDWREQVSAKVNSYKTRSRHKPRYPSLQLPFDEKSYRPRQSGADPTVRAANPVASFSQAVAAEIVAMQPAPAVQQERPRILLEATARVLEFPRTAPPVYDPDELAEPMLHRPRIVEAPELLPPPPAMGGILIESPAQPEPERQAGFDMPLRSTALSRRLWAAAVDWLLLAIAVASFTYVFVRITDVVPPWKTVAELCAILLAVLWPAYQYAFLVFCETTPGLRLARLQVQRFDGTPAARGLRRWRVLASFLSAASLGLGYAWCFLDEDQLSWHDRITRTHMAPKSSGAKFHVPTA
jgi:uncharacterized RDD family membrane protein YckC